MEPGVKPSKGPGPKRAKDHAKPEDEHHSRRHLARTKIQHGHQGEDPEERKVGAEAKCCVASKARRDAADGPEKQRGSDEEIGDGTYQKGGEADDRSEAQKRSDNRGQDQ